MISGEVSPRPPRPAPVVTDDSAAYWSAAREHRLVLQRCAGCERFHHPPRPMCPTCHETAHTWEPAEGVGTVYSYAILHHPQHPAFEYPVIAALVDLPEGVRLLTNLLDVDPGDVMIGAEVELMFVATDRDGAVPVFRPKGHQ